jgi:hypothetical protein
MPGEEMALGDQEIGAERESPRRELQCADTIRHPSVSRILLRGLPKFLSLAGGILVAASVAVVVTAPRHRHSHGDPRQRHGRDTEFPGGANTTITVTTSTTTTPPERHYRLAAPGDDACTRDGFLPVTSLSSCETAAEKLGVTGFFDTKAEACFRAAPAGHHHQHHRNGSSSQGTICEAAEDIRANGCLVCSPRRYMPPDVVIPFFERDLCKVKYTAQSLVVHDPEHYLGNVYLMWISYQAPGNYVDDLTEIHDILNQSRKVQLIDFSPQVKEAKLSGWFAQQVLKLKIAAIVESDFYVVLDAKNTFIKDLTSDAFFTSCNQARIAGVFRHDRIPKPHIDWYMASAKVLNLSFPSEGYWPSSITPMVIHRRTVIDVFEKIGEKAKPDPLCSGPLCAMFGARSMTGMGATEFTMYTLWAHSRPDFSCQNVMEESDRSDLAHRWAVSLWRGMKSNRDEQLKRNLERCEKIANGSEVPLMFGAQPEALYGISGEQREKAIKDVALLYQNAELWNPNKSATEELVECVIGRVPDAAEQEIEHADFGNSAGADGAGEMDTFCCTSTQDVNNFCQACWAGARVGPNDFCGQSEAHCGACGGRLCSR